MTQLSGKVALITGASSGIGQAAARLFAQEGARVVISGRRQDALDELATEIALSGGQVLAMAGDLRDEALAKALVDAAVSRFGGLDIAFNNAGTIGEATALTDMSVENWREVLDSNLTSHFLCAKYQLPAMTARGGGSLIFTSTFVGHSVGLPGMAAYAASKAGLIGMVKVIAAESGSMNIRANALLPGGTDTPMGRAVASTPESRSFVEKMHALNRLADPVEIARAALFLASDAASFVTGSAMLVDGGVSIYRGG